MVVEDKIYIYICLPKLSVFFLNSLLMKCLIYKLGKHILLPQTHTIGGVLLFMLTRMLKQPAYEKQNVYLIHKLYC